MIEERNIKVIQAQDVVSELVNCYRIVIRDEEIEVLIKVDGVMYRYLFNRAKILYYAIW